MIILLLFDIVRSWLFNQFSLGNGYFKPYILELSGNNP
jgi:hypothetical protein